MPIIYSMLLSVSLISLIGVILKKTINNRVISNNVTNRYEYVYDGKSISLFMAILTFSVLVFFVGVRSFYGDTSMYITEYNNYTPIDYNEIKESLSNPDIKGKLFLLIRCLIKRIFGDDYVPYFFILAFFQYGAIIKLFYKYSCNYFMTTFLFMASGYFTWSMNGIRQFTAICLILYFFEYIVEKKTLKFFIVVLIAVFIHSTALIWIPIYIVVNFKPWGKGIFFFIVAIIILLFSLERAFEILDITLENTTYNGYGEKILNAKTNGLDDGVSFIRVVIAAVPLLLSFFVRKNMEDAPRYINIFVNLSLITTCVYFVGVFTSGILVGRLPAYFSIFSYLLIPWLIKYKYGKNFSMLITIACYFFYFLYFYYDMVINGTGYYCSEILNVFYWERI